jgi:hypothetical protein
VDVRLLKSYIPIYVYGQTWLCKLPRDKKTIRVSEEYHAWLRAHKREGETMEETLRRMTRGPNPSDIAGLLDSDEADTAKAAVRDLRGRNRDRFDAARDAFEEDDAVLTANVDDFESLNVPVETYTGRRND